MWIFLAICSAASLGLANIAHKRLLDNYLEGVGALGAGSILTRSICAAIILIAVGWPVGAPTQSVAIALLSGVSLGSGLLLLFLGLKLGEASRAVAVSQTNPILVALLAMMVLGETITAPQWAAIALVIVGVALVSIEGFGRGLLKLTPGLTVLVGSSITLGLSFFLAKLVLDRPDAVGSFRVAGVGDGAGVRGLRDGRRTGAGCSADCVPAPAWRLS